MQRLLAVFLLCVSLTAIAADFRPFGRDSRAAIEHTYMGKPFVLVFWSVDCVYCVDELKQLNALAGTYPGLGIVLVSTDNAGVVQQAASVLAQHVPKLRGERWMFDETDPDRLYFSVDRKWHGELPRAYFYDTDGSVHTVAGQVDQQWLKHWVQTIYPAGR